MQALETVLPMVKAMLGNKEMVAALARRGFKIDSAALRSLEAEIKWKKSAMNPEVLDGKQFLVVVKQAYKDSKMPSITQWAGKLGVSYQFLSHVLRGDYNPGPAIAKALGYEQVYGFRRNPKDIRTAVAALAARKVKPMDGKATLGSIPLAPPSRKAALFIGKRRVASKKVRHGKKAQGKKK